MRIELNAASESFDGDSLSIREILERKRWSFPLIIATLNGELVPREDYGATRVREGDALELCRLVSGG